MGAVDDLFDLICSQDDSEPLILVDFNINWLIFYPKEVVNHSPWWYTNSQQPTATQVQSYKYLGAKIDSTLTYNIHVDWVCSQLLHGMFFFYVECIPVSSKSKLSPLAQTVMKITGQLKGGTFCQYETLWETAQPHVQGLEVGLSGRSHTWFSPTGFVFRVKPNFTDLFVVFVTDHRHSILFTVAFYKTF